MNEACRITVILDRSGSMETIREATISGFNEFLHGQKQVPGEAVISLFQFDDVFDTVYADKALWNAPPLTRETFVPRNWTALYDAIGRAMGIIDYKPKAEKNIVLIVTDGQENASKEFKSQNVRHLIKIRQDKGWQFVFLGSNQDAILSARGLGINVDNAMTFANNTRGITASFTSTGANAAAYRSGVAMNMAYSTADRKEQDEAAKNPAP